MVLVVVHVIIYTYLLIIMTSFLSDWLKMLS